MSDLELIKELEKEIEGKFEEEDLEDIFEKSKSFFNSKLSYILTSEEVTGINIYMYNLKKMEDYSLVMYLYRIL